MDFAELLEPICDNSQTGKKEKRRKNDKEQAWPFPKTALHKRPSTTADAMAFASRILLVLGALQHAAGLAPRQTSFEDQCANFDPAAAGVTNATVTNHAFVAAGTNISLPGGDASCGLYSQVVQVALCRVSLNISTTDRSGVVAEIWMPEEWNGRLVTTGNGGLGGCKFTNVARVLLEFPLADSDTFL